MTHLPYLRTIKPCKKKKTGCQLKIPYTDEGREYIWVFNNYLQENSIYHEITASYSPKQYKKTKKLTTLLWGLFELFSPNKIFQSSYE